MKSFKRFKNIFLATIDRQNNVDDTTGVNMSTKTFAISFDNKKDIVRHKSLNRAPKSYVFPPNVVQKSIEFNLFYLYILNFKLHLTQTDFDTHAIGIVKTKKF